MPLIPELPHVRLDGFSRRESYHFPVKGFPTFSIAQRNRSVHGRNLLNQLAVVRAAYELNEQEPIPEGIIRNDVLYVEFLSEYDLSLKFDSLHSDAAKPKYQILRVVRENSDNEIPHARFRTLVMLTKGGISHFIKKVSEYIDEKKDVIKVDDDGLEIDRNPKNNSLVANINAITLATVEAFWSDAESFAFPSPDEMVWWEAWFRRTADDESRIANAITNIAAVGAQTGDSVLYFPEHIVKLVRATSTQLSNSLFLLDNLAELRRPQETSECFTREGLTGREEWVTDLVARTDVEIDDNSTLICLLDSGVNNQHPLIRPFLPDDRLYSYNPAWGNHDSWDSGGHGTGMAGLAIYGDLNAAFSSPDRIRVRHGLESFKIKQYGVDNDPDLYGAITRDATNLPFADRPEVKRIFCLSITDPDFAFKGRPFSWSSSVDKIAFGDEQLFAAPQLIIISGGNIDINLNDEYPSVNETSSVHDPGQAYNALTVGSYTTMDRIDQITHPGWNPLAPIGAMAPSNSTSLMWDSQWPNKPDIVLEGGNMATNGRDVNHIDALQLLTAHKDHRVRLYQLFGDTSAAAALGAKMAAEITASYPDFWPETIRGLMIHSAVYTPHMIRQVDFLNGAEAQRRTLLRTYGYGVPNLGKALHSASNRLHLVMERTIQPYHQVGSNAPTYGDYHLYTLPWPADVLRTQLTDQNVTLKVTLSYFVEPNPGDRRYASSFQYHSHSLDFMVIKPAETPEEFQKRISLASEEEEQEGIDRTGEIWSFKRTRSRGSVKKDFIETSGAELSTRNVIAVYPKTGWYKTRKKLAKANSQVRYSLIISIETAAEEVDVYTPVMELIAINN